MWRWCKKRSTSLMNWRKKRSASKLPRSPIAFFAWRTVIDALSFSDYGTRVHVCIHILAPQSLGHTGHTPCGALLPPGRFQPGWSLCGGLPLPLRLSPWHAHPVREAPIAHDMTRHQSHTRVSNSGSWQSAYPKPAPLLPKHAATVC